MTHPTEYNAIPLEHDQVAPYVRNLIQHRKPFAAETDRSIGWIVSLGGEQIQRPAYDYIRKRALNMDEAKQYVTNLVGAELSFTCTPEWMPGGHVEWLFLVELRKSGRI